MNKEFSFSQGTKENSDSVTPTVASLLLGRLVGALLSVSDGILILLPACLAISTSFIMLQPMRSWRTEGAILFVGLGMGILLGMVTGWFVGRGYVGGQWLTRRARLTAFNLSGWLLFLGLVGVWYHDWILPLAEKLERRIAETRFVVGRQAKPDSSPAEKGAIEAANELVDSGAEVVRRGNDLVTKAHDEDAKKMGEEEVKKGKKILKAAEDVARQGNNPEKVRKILNDLATDLEKPTETKGSESVTKAGSLPVWVRILTFGGPLQNLLGFGWGGGTKEVRETIVRAYNGKPPSEADLRRLLSQLATPAERRDALAQLRDMVRLFHEKGRVSDAEWNTFDLATKTLTENEWVAFFKEVIQGIPPEAPVDTVAESVSTALSKALPYDNKGQPVFASEEQKNTIRDGLKGVGRADWEQIWSKSITNFGTRASNP